ncbi:MAG: rubredoxin [Sphaerochaetaceae bacterium]|jgi:rubredoxin
MRKIVCSVCGYVYDESKGVPEAGAASGTKWEDLPADWVCPMCGATKDEFTEQVPDSKRRVAKDSPPDRSESETDMQELSPLEMSVLCSNLARGCEKQYRGGEASLFTRLADYFKSGSAPSENPRFADLMDLIGKDLEKGMPVAKAVAGDVKDRGALRALVWSEKVTRILKSLLSRYEKEGNAMFEHTGVYVCTICGFVYVGDNPPALCPVCKVPNWKFEKIEGRVS